MVVEWLNNRKIDDTLNNIYIWSFVEGFGILKNIWY